ncbi:hypothetical protein TRVA0_010S00870 [Trichomonascus vanleenenianus]|uniref:uncharacterized protein n=1 Tax=Trichomonascus vanleenenianus TaxID=2268995 RepID=UPI003ECB6398
MNGRSLGAPENTEIVSRSSLVSNDVSDESDVDLSQYLPELEFSDVDQESHEKSEKMSVDDEEEGIAHFQLFDNDDPDTEINLNASGEEDPRVHLKRPDSYYFAKPSSLEKKGFAESAISGADIWSASNSIKFPALEMPWKVIDYTEAIQQAKKQAIRAHRRPGKKARQAKSILHAKKAEAAKLKRTSRKRQPPPAPSVGPEKQYGKDVNSFKVNRKANPKNKPKGKVVRGVSGKGGHPRKGAVTK